MIHIDLWISAARNALNLDEFTLEDLGRKAAEVNLRIREYQEFIEEGAEINEIQRIESNILFHRLFEAYNKFPYKYCDN